MITHARMLGDTRTPIGAQLKQANTTGRLEAVNLTGLTVKFHMVDDDGNDVVVETANGVTVVDAANGQVQYDFQAADVDTAGTFWAWFTVYAAGEKDTFPHNGRTLKVLIHDTN